MFNVVQTDRLCSVTLVLHYTIDHTTPVLLAISIHNFKHRQNNTGAGAQHSIKKTFQLNKY